MLKNKKIKKFKECGQWGYICRVSLKKKKEGRSMNIVKESPLGPDALQKTPFAAANPNLTPHEVQKIKMRTK
jgi:hypothetical protein